MTKTEKVILAGNLKIALISVLNTDVELISQAKYNRFMAKNPHCMGMMKNTSEQKINFYEHPVYGDESSIIAVCHELKLVASTGFFELDDMKAWHGEYEPVFKDGALWIGDCLNE